MWNDDNDTALASLWEFLVTRDSPVDSVTIRRETGLASSRVISGLAKLSEIELLALADKKNDAWELKKTLDAMDWARAVEIGVPLICLEKTMALSTQDRRRAEQALTSGVIDQERTQRTHKKVKKRQDIIRGRAASRAAATDLAKIVEDAHQALSQKSSKVNDVFRQEASKALEALIQAMEKTRLS